MAPKTLNPADEAIARFASDTGRPLDEFTQRKVRREYTPGVSVTGDHFDNLIDRLHKQNLGVEANGAFQDVSHAYPGTFTDGHRTNINTALNEVLDTQYSRNIHPQQVEQAVRDYHSAVVRGHSNPEEVLKQRIMGRGTALPPVMEHDLAPRAQSRAKPSSPAVPTPPAPKPAEIVQTRLDWMKDELGHTPVKNQPIVGPLGEAITQHVTEHGEILSEARVRSVARELMKKTPDELRALTSEHILREHLAPPSKAKGPAGRPRAKAPKAYRNQMNDLIVAANDAIDGKAVAMAPGPAEDILSSAQTDPHAHASQSAAKRHVRDTIEEHFKAGKFDGDVPHISEASVRAAAGSHYEAVHSGALGNSVPESDLWKNLHTDPHAGTDLAAARKQRLTDHFRPALEGAPRPVPPAKTPLMPREINGSNYKGYTAALKRINGDDANASALMNHMESTLEHHFTHGGNALGEKTINAVAGRYMAVNQPFINGEVPTFRTDLPRGEGHLTKSVKQFDRLHSLEHEVETLQSRIIPGSAHPEQKELLDKLVHKSKRYEQFKEALNNRYDKLLPEVQAPLAAVVTEAEHAAPGFLRRAGSALKQGGGSMLKGGAGFAVEAVTETAKGVASVGKGAGKVALIAAAAGVGLSVLPGLLSSPRPPRRLDLGDGADSAPLAFASATNDMGALAVPKIDQQQSMGSWVSRLPAMQDMPSTTPTR